ncbi:hypothetical protein R3P38DRAFT_2747018 [Favolaschia claudopus]|uniref:Uncharacterized protein n=1 Tax=Favolaschia claudopus TaxID=2862362 RepID=A0AAV9ZEI2_9AGAR
MLDVLFVQLTNPPKDIALPGLPPNVVALPRATKAMWCTLPDDMTVQISREQVLVLPNFAMTDYASQGKTRAWNVVDLHNCKDNLSYYTALSRGSSAAGTVIVQGMDTTKITKGITGFLRQELRELEVLDEITAKIYEGHLIGEFNRVDRRELISAYRKHVRRTQEKSVAEDMTIKEPGIGMGSWKLVGDDAKKPNKKRKADAEEAGSIKPKRNKSMGPHGLRWDGADYSCAYDSLFTILGAIWRENTARWTQRFGTMSKFMRVLGSGFQRNSNRVESLENARDEVRKGLWALDGVKFPKGQRFTALSDVAEVLFGETEWGTHVVKCLHCGLVVREIGGFRALKYIVPEKATSVDRSIFSIADWINKYCLRAANETCTQCGRGLAHIKTAKRAPPVLVFVLTSPDVHINMKLRLLVDNNGTDYQLSGVVYGGRKHYTCRVVCKNGDLWYNDGIETGQDSVYEGVLHNEDGQFINHCVTKETTRDAVAVVYSLAD